MFEDAAAGLRLDGKVDFVGTRDGTRDGTLQFTHEQRRAGYREVRKVREFRDKVAVVTGAASGIGRAIARQCAAEGMKVVMADVEGSVLEAAARELRGGGASIVAVETDVSDAAQVEALAAKTLSSLNGVHLLFNNAGVGAGSSIWESSYQDWQWVLGVNLWGAIHGIKVFVPLMLEEQTDCHIVNTASMAGLTAGPGLGIYKASKHALVSLSETLYCELMMRNARIGVSVLCPSWVNTSLLSAERNRPEQLRNPPASQRPTNQDAAILKMVSDAVAGGMPPKEVAERVFEAIRENRFYILTHAESKAAVQARMEDILKENNPRLSW